MVFRCGGIQGGLCVSASPRLDHNDRINGRMPGMQPQIMLKVNSRLINASTWPPSPENVILVHKNKHPKE